MATGRTTLVIAHRLSTIVNSDEIIVLKGGKIAERGKHLELLNAGGEYAKLWMMQAKQAENSVEISAAAPMVEIIL